MTTAQHRWYTLSLDVCAAYAAGELDEDEMVAILSMWEFAPIPDVPDTDAGISSEARGYAAGSAQEIVKALNRRLISREVYERIRDAIHRRQGGNP